MGTRGSYGFKLNGEFVLQYNHFDSYQGGLGEEIVKFVKHVQDNNFWNQLKDNIKKLEFVNTGDTPTPEHMKQFKRFRDKGVNAGEGYYSLLRNLQNGESLYTVLNGEVLIWAIDNDFIKESLFCEYAYIIDLDEETLWFCEGFQKELQEDNPFGIKNDSDYCPVRVLARIPFNEVTNEKMNKIYEDERKRLNDDEDEEVTNMITVDCPNCGGQDYTEMYNEWVSGDKLCQHVECNNCNAKFDIYFEPSNTELIETPEPQGL